MAGQHQPTQQARPPPPPRVEPDVVELVHQNQRFWPLSGWGRTLKTERKAFR